MKSRHWRIRLGLVGLGILVALLLGEGALRAMGYSPQYVNGVASFHEHDPDVGLRGKPGFSGYFRQPDFDVRVEIDSNGFRKAGRSVEGASEDRQRLYVFGDSFTWGWGVDQGESFSDLLAQEMPELEVHNYGLSGTGTVIQHLLFERHVRDSLRPSDLVLLAFYENDLPDNLGQRMEEWAHARVVNGKVEAIAPPPPSLAVRIKNVFKDHSYLGNLAAFVSDRRRIRRRQAEAEQVAHERLVADSSPTGDADAIEYADDSPEVIVLRHYLELFRRDVEQAGARFAMVCIPGRTVYGEGLDDAPAEPVEAARHRAALRTARALDIQFLDLLPSIRAEQSNSSSQRLTFHHDPHWNVLGHRLAARELEPFLREAVEGER